MDVIASLDQMRAAINVLEHPFYERWSGQAFRVPSDSSTKGRR